MIELRGYMLRFGGAPSPPPAPPPPPTPTDPSVLQAQRDQAIAQAQAAGRYSTILTSGQGDTSAPTIGKQTLLGQ